jgi:diamine N-acetyltransferase
VIAYLNYDTCHRKAELRKLVGHPLARGKGLGLAATRLWIRYGRDGLALKKIYLNTLDTNIRNIRLNEELGFKIEGILRNELFIDGTYRDVLRMSLWLD